MNTISREEYAQLLIEGDIKPRLRRELRFVSEEITGWAERDFLAVTNRARSEGVLVASLEQEYVVAFRLQKRTANKTGRIEAITCDFCATWQRGANSAVVIFQKAASTVSFLCCADLLCSLHVRDKTAIAKLSRTQLRENTSVKRRVKRLRTKLEAILSDL